MSVLMVDKHMHKICCSMKDTVESLDVDLQRIIKGLGFFMWTKLLPMPEDCVKVAGLITKDLILRTKYDGRCRTEVGVFKVPPQIIRKHLFIYLSQYRQILSATCDNLNGDGVLTSSLFGKPSSPDPKCFDVVGLKMSVIVTS